MKRFSACPTCGDYAWLNAHTCPPSWIVAPEDSPQETMLIHAHDAEGAAEKWGERYDPEGCEYYLAKGNEMVALVGRPNGEIVRVAVRGETVPNYTARELGPAPAPRIPNGTAGKVAVDGGEG